MKETTVQKQIMLAVSESGCTVFRNNIGVHKTEDGRFIRYGVGSPGGSDLIGWKSVTITPDMVGKKVALFTAVEVKTKTGRVTQEQQNFIVAVNHAGGIGFVARSAEDALTQLGERLHDNQ